MKLPDSATGPKAKPASDAKALTLALDRHAVPSEMRARIAEALKSRMLPKSIQTPEQAVVIALKGRELGLPMMQAFSSIHVIQGVPTLSASLMLGVVFRHLPGFDYQVVERSAQRCRLRGRRSPQHSWIESTYTMAEAKQSGDASKANYAKIPADMLYARAAARLARMVAPDMLAGLYDPNEILGGDVDATDPGEEPAEVVPVEPPPETPAIDADFEETTWRDQTLAAVLELAREPEVRAAAEAAGVKGRPVAEWTDDEIRELCRKAGGPLAQYAEAGRDPGDETENPFD